MTDRPRRALVGATAPRSSFVPGGGLLGATSSSRPCTAPFGEDGSVQGLLEWLDVPYVGSDVLASAICMDKLTLKRLFARHGVPQVDFAAAGRGGLARALPRGWACRSG